MIIVDVNGRKTEIPTSNEINPSEISPYVTDQWKIIATRNGKHYIEKKDAFATEDVNSLVSTILGKMVWGTIVIWDVQEGI